MSAETGRMISACIWAACVIGYWLLTLGSRSDITRTINGGTGGKQMTAAELKKMNEQREFYKTLFDLVCDPRDWKAPINASVELTTLCKLKANVQDLDDAIAFFTATRASYTATLVERRGALLVQAPGYRAGPAGP